MPRSRARSSVTSRSRPSRSSGIDTSGYCPRRADPASFPRARRASRRVRVRRPRARARDGDAVRLDSSARRADRDRARHADGGDVRRRRTRIANGERSETRRDRIGFAPECESRRYSAAGREGSVDRRTAPTGLRDKRRSRPIAASARAATGHAFASCSAGRTPPLRADRFRHAGRRFGRGTRARFFGSTRARSVASCSSAVGASEPVTLATVRRSAGIRTPARDSHRRWRKRPRR